MVHPAKSPQSLDSTREGAGPTQASPAKKSWNSGAKASAPKAPSTPTQSLRFNPCEKTHVKNSQVHPRVARCKPAGMSPLRKKCALEGASSTILNEPVSARVMLATLDEKKR